MIGVALLIGFRPNATPFEWLALIGILVLLSLALIWLSVALGLVSKTVETGEQPADAADPAPLPGSGFVPTDSMPAGLRLFAEYQPFTPIIETLRGLLLGTAIGNSAVARRRVVGGRRPRLLPVGEAALRPRELSDAP